MKARLLHYGPVVGLCLLVGIAGCESTEQRQARVAQGYVYYCDGAGGGGLMNWSGGLKSGLKKGGYPGAGEIFGWNTGLGVVPDQDSSVEYKRGKARTLGQKTAKYKQENPNGPVTFIGLSAGTSIVVFGLEELPAGAKVEDAIMCGCSTSATYDLTRALRNLDDKMYVFTSQNDGVLRFMVPMSGTADRAAGSVPSAGLGGFRMPRNASAETRQLYRKVVTIPWRPEFSKLGYTGGHTNVLSERFVAAYMAPLLSEKVAKAPPALASRVGEVKNPDYDRWARFGKGSYAVFEGHQVEGGKRSPLRVKETLVSKSADRVLVKREYYLTDRDPKHPAQTQSMIAESWIDPSHHPYTDPKAKRKALAAKRFTVKGKEIDAKGFTEDAPGSYPEWGRARPKGTAYYADDVPGKLVSIKMAAAYQGATVEVDGTVVDYKVMR